MGMRGNVTMI